MDETYRMYAMVGRIFKLKGPTPILFGRKGKEFDPPPGTFVRLTAYTPDTPGMNSGNHWCIETLDGKFSARQIYQDELEELTALDRMSLIGNDD